MNHWYKDRDFPEVKASNSDIVACIERPKELQRVIDEHNTLVDRVMDLRSVVNEAAVRIWTVYRDLDKGVNATQRQQLYELNRVLVGALNEKAK